MSEKKHTPLTRKPWFEFLSSMRFAVSLLTVLGIASVIGTVMSQNEAMANYAFKFGPFWFEIFKFLGLYDVYSAPWFVGILIFLVLSVSLCLIRNTPNFLREMKNFRLRATETSLRLMKHHQSFDNNTLSAEAASQYLSEHGYSVKSAQREDGNTIIAAKKGSANKLGYLFAHISLIVICVGALIDSDILLKARVAFGQLVPDKTANFANEFGLKSKLGMNNLSFRSTIHIREGSTVDVAFLNMPDGSLVQELPFTVNLKKFTVDYYDNGMPKNYVSQIEVTEKANGKVTRADVRVNHPLTVNGVTIYQSSFSDGGSKLNFNAWNLSTPSAAVPLNAVSMNSAPFPWQDKQTYTLEFGELRILNIENTASPESGTQAIDDVRAVTKNTQFKNIGPSISYKLRDETGQAQEYLNYMSPLEQNKAFFLVTGARREINANFTWTYLPLDTDNTLNTFMLLKNSFQSPQMRKDAVNKVLQQSPENTPEGLKLASEAVMNIFAQKGYIGVQEFMKNMPLAPTEKQKVERVFLEVLHRASSELLISAQTQAKLPVWAASDERSQFIVNAMIAMTNLQDYGSPVYLQLENFEQVQASGLQMTRSPGKNMVYLGSLLLILGIYCMFYIREKRAWFLLKNNQLLFSISSNRNESGLDKEFDQHTQNIKQLLKSHISEPDK